MVAIYRADTWCDDCGRAIARDLLAARDFPRYWTPAEVEAVEGADGDATAARVDFDSGDWPSLDHPEEPTDSPQHCGSDAECLNAEVLSDGSRVGALLGEDLTEEGAAGVREAIEEDRASGRTGTVALEVWEEAFEWYL